MTDREGFLKTIAANPDDDLPRLVYADWLDENGENLLGEFIRTQIEIAKSPATRQVIYLHEYTSPTKDKPEVQGKIKNVSGPDRTRIFEMVSTYVDWCLGLTINPTKVSDYWPIRGTGILERATITPTIRGNEFGLGVRAQYDLEVTIIPVVGQENHWVIRDRLQKLKAREQELWQEPEVRNHYNQLTSQTGYSSSSQVVLEYNGASFTLSHSVYPTHYLVGLVRRGMVEEVKLPIGEWTRNRPNPYCQACDGHGQYPQHHGPDDNYDVADCPYCPTLGQLILQAHPVKKVWASDRQPYVSVGDGAGCHWYDGERRTPDGIHPESNLPTEVYQKLKGGEATSLGFRVYDTELAATDDLSQALLSLANPKAT